MIPMLLSYIDENITMSSEAVLMKNHRVNGSGIAEKNCRVCGSGIDVKSQ